MMVDSSKIEALFGAADEALALVLAERVAGPRAAEVAKIYQRAVTIVTSPWTRHADQIFRTLPRLDHEIWFKVSLWQLDDAEMHSKARSEPWSWNVIEGIAGLEVAQWMMTGLLRCPLCDLWMLGPHPCVQCGVGELMWAEMIMWSPRWSRYHARMLTGWLEIVHAGTKPQKTLAERGPEEEPWWLEDEVSRFRGQTRQFRGRRPAPRDRPASPRPPRPDR